MFRKNYLVFTNHSYWREKKIPFISARSITLISHQSKHKLIQMVEKDASGSGTTNWLLFALVFLVYFFFSLFLKLINLFLPIFKAGHLTFIKKLKISKLVIMQFQLTSLSSFRKLYPYIYLYMLHVSKLLNPLCIRHL